MRIPKPHSALPDSSLHNPHAIREALTVGPVYVAQDDEPMAVLISMDQWHEVKHYVQQLEFIVESERIIHRVKRDPSSLVSHAELKRKLAEKRAQLESERQAKNKSA